MRTLTIVFFIGFHFVFIACSNYSPSENTLDYQSQVSMGKSDSSVLRDGLYYLSKGYQVFKEYNLAVKAPVKLKDVSNQTSGDFDFVFGGILHKNSSKKFTMYQVMINKLPAGYRNIPANESDKIERKLLDEFYPSTQKQKVVFLEQNAYVYDYTHEGAYGRSIVFIREDCSYAFNMITTDNINEKFNSFTNNITFIESKSKVKSIHQTVPGFKSFSSKTLSIDYPDIWIEENTGNPNVLISLMEPFIDDYTFRQNFNIVISNENRSYDRIWASSKKQLKKYIKDVKIIDRTDYNLTNVKGKKTEFKGYLENFLLHWITFEFLHNDKLITITFTTDSSSLSEKKKNITEIINTLILH